MGQEPSTAAKQEIAERLWDEHGAAVYRFALRLSGNRSVAEDIAGETILAALEALQRRNPDQLHRAYLFGIVVNKWHRVRRVEPDPITELLASKAANLDSLIDFERAFRQLPPKLQEVFVLVRAEGVTSREAAEVLSLPQGTVQARVHEAVHRMRRTLGAEYSASTATREAQS